MIGFADAEKVKEEHNTSSSLLMPNKSKAKWWKKLRLDVKNCE